MFINLIVRGSNISPWGLAFWRDFTTFAVLLVGLTLFRRDLLRVNRRDLPWLAAMGSISIGLFHVMWNTSVLMNGVAVSTVFQSNAPILVTVIAWFLWREPLTRRKLGAVALAVGGTALISRLDDLSASQITPFGFLLGIGVAVAFCTFSLLGKRLSGQYSAWTILLYIFGFGALALLPFQIGSSVPWPVSVPVAGYFSGLIFVTTIVGFALFTSSLKSLQASVATIVSTTEVAFAALISYLTLGERLEVQQMIGAAMVIGGVVLVSWPKRRPPLPIARQLVMK